MPTSSTTESMAEFAMEVVSPAIAPADLTAPMFKRALVSVKDELLAMDERRLVSVNVDVYAATTIVLGAARELRALRPAMVEQFGEAMASQVDRLELLARALGQAHARHRAVETGTDIQPLATAVGELRGALLAEVHSLAARKRVSLATLGALRGGTGFRNLGFDVVQLIAFLTDHWETIESATGYTMAELEEAEGLANQLITAVGLREQPTRSPTANLRDRAFSLLYETYDDVRRMVGFLRWKQGDADRIAPSWYRGRRSAKATPEAAEPAEAPLGLEGPLAAEALDVRPGMPGAPAFTTE